MTAGGPTLEIVHLSGKRARFRLEAGLEPGDIAALADRLAGLPDVSRALVRPKTRSVIVETVTPAAEVLRAIPAGGIARVVPGKAPPPVGQSLQMGLLGGDMAMRRGTDNAIDLRTAIALVLFIAAIVQVFRGKLVGPTTTLLLSALSLIDQGAARR